MPTAGQIYQDHSNAIEEILNRNVEVILPETDPFYRKVYNGKLGTGSVSEIGRDMKIIRTFIGTFAGVMNHGASTNDFTLYGDGNGSADLLGGAGQQRLRFQNPTNAWPDPADGPTAQPIQLAIPMRSSFTSIGITLGEMQAEAHPAYIAEVINPKMMGFSRMMSHAISLDLYLSQNDNYKLATLNASTWSYVDSNKAIELTPDNYAIHRFAVGMRVYIIDSSAAGDPVAVDSNGEGTMFVTMVDENKNKVHLRHRTNGALNGTTTFTAALADGDYIVLPGTRAGADSFRSYAGLNSWLKTGDTSVASNGDTRLLGAEADSTRYIDVNQNPEFKSIGINMGGQALTEHYLRRVFRLFHNAKSRYGYTIDTLLFSDGVDLSMQQQMIGRETIDRTGRLASMRHMGSDNGEGPQVGIRFTMDGRVYTGYISNMIESGAVYGVKCNNQNWQRYSPPWPKGVSASSELEFAPFAFVANQLGGYKNMMPYFQTSGSVGLPMEMVQMPGMVRMQMVPKQACGLKLTNVQEQRLFSDN